jgi:hypothetical protein
VSTPERVGALDWQALAGQLDDAGLASTGPLLTTGECVGIAGLYDDVTRFRSTIDMGRHRFGSGEHRYFDYPLPELVAQLRHAFYPRLLAVARAWADRLGRPAARPDSLDEWLDRCHRAGQCKPTPVLLRYAAGDWNALHRDLYGDLVLPLQVVIGLDRPGADYSGGELLLVEQRPRAQSRGHAVVIEQGHGIVFTTRDRPFRSARGWSSSPVRHGVSTVRSGRRRTLGLLFHDAA